MDRTFEIGDRVFSVNGGYGIVVFVLSGLPDPEYLVCFDVDAKRITTNSECIPGVNKKHYQLMKVKGLF